MPCQQPPHKVGVVGMGTASCGCAVVHLDLLTQLSGLQCPLLNTFHAPSHVLHREFQPDLDPEIYGTFHRVCSHFLNTYHGAPHFRAGSSSPTWTLRSTVRSCTSRVSRSPTGPQGWTAGRRLGERGVGCGGVGGGGSQWEGRGEGREGNVGIRGMSAQGGTCGWVVGR